MKKFILLFFSAFLFACPVFSEQINWETIERLSKENNPLIKTAHFKLENAKQAYNRSLSGFFPNVSLTGSTSQSGGQDNFTRNNSYGLNASLSVFSGFETYNDVKQKAAELKAAEISYIRTVSDIVYEGALAYINLMWACETVELSKQIYERRKENRDMIKLKYNSGNVDIGSLERVEADVEMANYDLKKALRNIESVSSALLKVIGRNDSSTLEALEKINIDFQEIEKPDYVSLVETLPEFLIARYSLESSKFQTAKTKGAWLPEISFSASASRSGSQWTPERDGWNAGISVSYQLFNGGARYADTKTALNNLKIAEENIKETLNSLKAKAVANYNSLSDAFENIAVRQHYLKASSLQAEISAKKYVNGLSTYQDWYSIENDFINSQKTLLDVKKAAALEMAQWNNFKGAGFGSFANDNILAPVSE